MSSRLLRVGFKYIHRQRSKQKLVAAVRVRDKQKLKEKGNNYPVEKPKERDPMYPPLLFK